MADLPEPTKTTIIRIANKAGLDTTPMSWAGDIKWENTPKFLDDIRFNIKKEGLGATINKGLDTAAENINMGLSVRAKGGIKSVEKAQMLKDYPDPVQNPLYDQMRKAQDNLMSTIDKEVKGKYKNDSEMPKELLDRLNALKKDWNNKEAQWSNVYRKSKTKIGQSIAPTTEARPAADIIKEVYHGTDQNILNKYKNQLKDQTFFTTNKNKAQEFANISGKNPIVL